MRLKRLQEIIKVLEESDIEELEIKGLFRSVRVSKKATTRVIPTTKDSPRGQKEIIIEKKQKDEDIHRDEGVSIKAPMVGTFYNSSSPETPPYVEVGDKVTVGKAVCIIEAMKVMNEIESDVSGTIVEVLVKNEEAVEYGQPLFLVEPE
ncbi:acetyl-CoA carboxylase biotin carboxyl carrier protein [candidate division WOR-3 bacterium]|nr:acetyl-CoA carboxylase biotin carboxyl carrier protein [candidate division WOR-3 bacterium]